MSLILKPFDQHSHLINQISFFTVIAKLELHASLQKSFILQHLSSAIHGNQIYDIFTRIRIICLILSLTVTAKLRVGWSIWKLSVFIYIIYIYSHFNELLTNAQTKLIVI
jgi:hypothetical protein